MTPNGRRRWWDGACVYQAYLPAFTGDSDGVSALGQLTARLDYLNDGTSNSLGVDAIYVTPMYPDSGYDGGYDVVDHSSVAQWAGDEDDFAVLVDAAHSRGIRILLDLVANHTSCHHPWFTDSRDNPAGTHGDWYYWHPGDGSQPPNNWQSEFGPVGSAWSYSQSRGQYYLHSFLPQQPDLDWRNPNVRAAMLRIMEVWLDRGIDGFRIDAAHRLGKDPEMRNNVGIAFCNDRACQRRDSDWPTGREYLAEMRVLADRSGALLVGETYILNSARVAAYVVDGNGLDLAHDFVLIHQPWQARAMGAAVRGVELAHGLQSVPAWLLGNHDHSRLATRLGAEGVGHPRAKVAAMLLLTLRGTVFVYQGEEAGLTDREPPDTCVRDVLGRECYRGPLPECQENLQAPSRRALGYPARHVSSEFTSLYRKLVWLRKQCPSLRWGSWTEIPSENEEILAYERSVWGTRVLVALNFSSEVQPARLLVSGEGVPLLSTGDRTAAALRVDQLVLAPNEGVIVLRR